MRRSFVLVGMVLGLFGASCSQNPEPIEMVVPAATLAPTIGLQEAETTPKPTSPRPTPTAEDRDAYAGKRESMVQSGVIAWGIEDELVISAMGVVPRHEFVPTEYLSQAYENHPLPIGHGQTISQPYIVALMTQEAGVGPADIVLEIGTGSSYQAAVLAELVEHVYSIEIIGALAETAESTLVVSATTT